MEKPQIGYLNMTCGACPSQWEGMTANGSHLYIRYRWGYLSCEIAGIQIYGQKIGDDMHGVMGTSELETHLSDVLDFTNFEYGMSN